MKNRKLYSKYTDSEYLFEVVESSGVVEPNDNAITDAEILSGRLASSYHGTFTKFEDGLNPLHRRGVDFTDLGNILAAVDAQEETTTNSIAARRAELAAADPANVDKSVEDKQ